jgi:hypothetical protein
VELALWETRLLGRLGILLRCLLPLYITSLYIENPLIAKGPFGMAPACCGSCCGVVPNGHLKSGSLRGDWSHENVASSGPSSVLTNLTQIVTKLSLELFLPNGFSSTREAAPHEEPELKPF